MFKKIYFLLVILMLITIHEGIAGAATIIADQSVADKFVRHTVTGITTLLPVSPDVAGFKGAAFVSVADLDGNGINEIICTSGMGTDMSFWSADGAVAIFTRDDADMMSSWTQSIIRADFAFPNETIIRDMDGDDDKDIVVFDNFLAGAYTNKPAGIYLLKNLGGDITSASNWERSTIYAIDPSTVTGYDKAKARASYHRGYFFDIDGDGVEDFTTTRVSMEIWQAPSTNTDLYGKQYNWAEWFRGETDLVTYPSGFSGPYDIGDGGGFLFNMIDIDDDGDLDFVAPQFFITTAGTLVVKGPDDINGDSLIWFENPGPAALRTNPGLAWTRYTVDNWYTSANPMGKGMEVVASDIDNDGKDELVYSTHNHQDYKPDNTYTARIWPSGIYYLEIPDNPASLSQWDPISIDTGDPSLDPYDSVAVAADVYAVDRIGGPYSQGSPGAGRAADITGDGYADLVVPGDGKGSVYYYESQGEQEGVLAFKRAGLYVDPACMPGESEIVDIDGDGDLDIITVIYDTSVLKDTTSYSSSVFIFENTSSICGNGIIESGEECEANADCEAEYGSGWTCSGCVCQEPTLISLSSFEAVAGSNKVTLEWTTESETDNAGFNIYRSSTSDGSYEKINTELIPAKGSATQGASYKYVDDGVTNRITYYYKLEDIDQAGTGTMHGPASATPRLIFGLFR